MGRWASWKLPWVGGHMQIAWPFGLRLALHWKVLTVCCNGVWAHCHVLLQRLTKAWPEWTAAPFCKVGNSSGWYPRYPAMDWRHFCGGSGERFVGILGGRSSTGKLHHERICTSVTSQVPVLSVLFENRPLRLFWLRAQEVGRRVWPEGQLFPWWMDTWVVGWGSQGKTG